MSAQTDETTVMMKDIDRRFQVASGLRDRRDYSIFYSRLQPSPLIVIGIKPGGRRDGTHQLASQSFYENGEHEYVDMNYRIAAVMRPALVKALGLKSSEELRSIPKTNCIFHRAVGTDDFTSTEMREHAVLCAPFLAEMLNIVRPSAIILEGAKARELFVRHHCRNVQEHTDQRVVGIRRGALNTFFRSETALLRQDGRAVKLLTLGHPSQFGHLPTWDDAINALASALATQTNYPSPQSVTASAPAAASNSKPDLQSGNKVTAGLQSLGTTKPTNDRRQFKAANCPPESFRYSPIQDFWRELIKTGPMKPDQFFQHLNSVGWTRPSGRPLTPQIVRTDLVSMVKHGFAVVHSID